MTPEERVKVITERLQGELTPSHLEVIDESHLHVGHEGAKDGRGHFRVLLVSEHLNGLSALARHRRVYAAMGELMTTDIHALSLELFTPDEL